MHKDSSLILSVDISDGLPKFSKGADGRPGASMSPDSLQCVHEDDDMITSNTDSRHPVSAAD